MTDQRWCRAQDISNAIWGFAKLYHLPPNDLLQAASLYLLRHWHRFKPQELASVLWSLAVLKACNPDVWCAGAPSRWTRPGATTVVCLEAGAWKGHFAWHRRLLGERIGWLE